MFLPVLLVASLSFAPPNPEADQQKRAPSGQRPVASVEWKDASGDVEEQGTSTGTVPGFDLAKLAITTDGSALTIAATLAAPPKGDFASDVATVFVDTDNNPATGVSTPYSKRPGFELRAKLSLCIEYADGSRACAGGLSSKVKAYYSTIEFGTLQSMGGVKDFYRPFREPTGTVQGAVITASLPYKDLGVKSGQTIRISARESDGPYDETADFPVTLLTLK